MKKLTVIYDCDDTLNNLNECVANQLGIDANIIKYYNIDKNSHIPKEIRDKILELYSSIEVFRQVKFVPGAERIFNAKKLGADVKINSASLTRDIADYKFISILTSIPDVEGTDLILPVIDGVSKGINEQADIAVEDCIEHLLKYPKHTVKILIDKSYNKFENYGISEVDSCIIRVTDLNSAVNLVESILNLIQSK